jgi:DNA-binding CsgD family transcriptional regulator
MLEGFDESARVFEQDREGYIWVSHAYKGLYRIKLTDEVDKIEDIAFYTVEDGLPDSLFLNVVTIKKEIVVTSPHGIYKFDHDSNSFVVHDELSAIFHGGANVHRLLEDKNGNIWFSIDNEFGILKIEEEGLLNNIEIAYFNQVQEDLVDGFEYVYALDTEHVLIGTENGFVLYKSQLLKTTDFPFGVLVREVSTTAGQDSIVFVDNGAPLKDLPKFKWVNNDLRFTYAAPYFDKIDNVVYRYQLVGFDEGWSEWSDRTEKEYTNLEDKKYMFEVQAKNAYGTVSDVKTFEFKVMPPWYKTLLAKIFYAIAGTLLLFGLLRNVSIREKKKTESFKREQEQKLLKKEQEFKKETERSENEIVRLRNEKLRADVVHKNSELASATMHLVQKSEILLKLKNDIKLIAKDSPEPVNKELRRILRTIDSDIQLDENWDKFESFFDKVHEDFFKRLRHKFPDLTPKDQKLCAYLRMNLTTKEIAPLLNISVRGVEISRYRLRKKLELDSSINLVSYIMDI